MEASTVTLRVPAAASFARSVRMMASNLAVLCAMSVDDVEDARMAAEEAFVYACATRPSDVEVSFCVTDSHLSMSFSLGDADPTQDDSVLEQVSLAQMLLGAVCDSYAFSDDGTALTVVKHAGGDYGD